MPPKDFQPLLSDPILMFDGQPLSGVQCVENSCFLENESEEAESLKPLNLTSSFSVKMEMTKETKNFLQGQTRTRPDRCKKCHYKWRLRKKWFNRYERKRWIGRELLMDVKDMGQMGFRITDAKLTKDGLDLTSEPLRK